jgi:hypothetical protein
VKSNQKVINSDNIIQIKNIYEICNNNTEKMKSFLNSIKNLGEITSCLFEVQRISFKLSKQDEEDKNLMGL